MFSFKQGHFGVNVCIPTSFFRQNPNFIYTDASAVSAKNLMSGWHPGWCFRSTDLKLLYHFSGQTPLNHLQTTPFLVGNNETIAYSSRKRGRWQQHDRVPTFNS